VTVERRDYFRDRFSIEELRSLLAELGIGPADVLSKRSRAYQARRDEIDAMDDAALIGAMVNEPTLLRRPLVVSDKRYTVGFDRKGLEHLTNDERSA
jgi:regulatory protein spx